MILRPPRSQRTDTLLPYTTLCRSDRFLICDIFNGQLYFRKPGGTDVINDTATGIRTRIGTGGLRYGAAYYPHLETTLSYQYDEMDVDVTGSAVPVEIGRASCRERVCQYV